MSPKGREWLEALAAAFQFLTRIPIPMRVEFQDHHFRRSIVFYPYVGLVIGCIVAVAGRLLEPLLPPMAAGVLLVALWTMLSGGLHLDGLMDTADGLLSHRSRERMLEIMKDSRVGAMGVMACVFAVGLKVALISSLLGNAHEKWLLLVVLIPVWSRGFLGTAIACWPYARQGQGLGALFRSVDKRHAGAAGAGALLLSAIMISIVPGLDAGAKWLLLLGAPIVCYGLGVLLSAAVHRKLGGLTGDVYGALNECIEIGLLLALASYAYHA